MPTLPPCSPLRADDPRRLGRYALLGRLGRGAQGVVYLGRTGDGRMVALKLLHADRVERPGARKRLAKEAATARRIRGRCTARILDVDVAGPRPYIVTEYVPGPSLHRRVRDRGPLSGAPLDRLMIGTATALVAIHAAGIVHRDLKPANVMLGPEGPRVIDFGVAHMDDASATLTGAPVGTPAYMAPEQVAGEPAGGPADVFAWASTMVYAATGAAPFGRDNAGAVMNRVAHDEPDLADLHGPVLELLRACLCKDPDDRPPAEHVLRRLLELSTRRPAGRSRTAMLAAGTRAASSPADRKNGRTPPRHDDHQAADPGLRRNDRRPPGRADDPGERRNGRARRDGPRAPVRDAGRAPDHGRPQDQPRNRLRDDRRPPGLGARGDDRDGRRDDPGTHGHDGSGGPSAGSPGTDRRPRPKVPEWMRDRAAPSVRRTRDLLHGSPGPARTRARDDAAAPPSPPRSAPPERAGHPRPGDAPARPPGTDRARSGGEDPDRNRGADQAQRTDPNRAQGHGADRARGSGEFRAQGRSSAAGGNRRANQGSGEDRTRGHGTDRARGHGTGQVRDPGSPGRMSAVRRHGYVIAVIITMLIGLALGLTSPWASSSGSPGPSASATP